MPSDILQNISLAPYTTLHVGGPARYFSVVNSEDQLKELCIWAFEQKQPVFVIGGGSNVLISDGGYKGLVLMMDIKGQYYSTDNVTGETIAEIKAGEVWDDFVSRGVEEGCGGLASLSGIPGKVGGSVVQNIGAYGVEVCELVGCVRFYDRGKEQYCEIPSGDCSFGYRSSIFKDSQNYIITSVKFSLRKEKPVLSYKDLMSRFPEGTHPTARQVREAVLDIRRSKSMLYDINDPNSKSAGSFFKNPVVSSEVFEQINKRYEDIPSWRQSGGWVKLSAGWLIENSGLPKGYVFRDGKVGLSDKHALAIINLGSAAATDVWEFSRYVQEKVKGEFGVQLDTEVVYIGF